MPANIFTTNLVDIIISDEAEKDISKIKRIFLLMEFAAQDDLKSLLNKNEKTNILG